MAGMETLRAFHQAVARSPTSSPRRYEFVDELPRSPIGKLRRDAIRERFS